MTTSATITQPSISSQTNTRSQTLLMGHHPEPAFQRAQLDKHYFSQPTCHTELTADQIVLLHYYIEYGEVYFNDQLGALTQLHGTECYTPNKENGFELVAYQKPLPGYQDIKKQYDIWLNNNDSQHEAITTQSSSGAGTHRTTANQTSPALSQTKEQQYYPKVSSDLLPNDSPCSRQYTSTSLQHNPYRTSANAPQAQHIHSQTKLPNSSVNTQVSYWPIEPKATPTLTGNWPGLMQQKPITNLTQPEPVKPKPFTIDSAFKEPKTKHQPPKSGLTPSTWSWENIAPPQQKTPPVQGRQASNNPAQTLVEDVILPTPPSVTNADRARRLLEEEFENQLQNIDTLKIEERYEPKNQDNWTGKYTPKTGARKQEFKKDLHLQLENGNLQIDQCHTPEKINKVFQAQWLSMKRLGVYRHWRLRQPAPNNPLPHYTGRVSIRNTGQSCGPDASIIQLLHSGTMNYFIFRPIQKETERNALNSNKNNIDHQTEWQRLYREILFGSPYGGQIEVPDWIRWQFDGMWNFTQVNSYTGSFFDPAIAWSPKEPLKRLNTPGTDTPKMLEERILGDWRACRLHTAGWHYTALIKEKSGKITSIDMGNLGTRTFNNSKELLDLFLAGHRPYHDPSLIEFWE